MDYSRKVNEKENGVVFSKTIKAGKRIYYFDVRKNKRGELFLTITESRKVSLNENSDQPFQFEKHKIFLYKEDFNCFMNEMKEVIEYIKENNTVDFVPQYSDKDKIKAEDPNSKVEFIEEDFEGINLKIDL